MLCVYNLRIVSQAPGDHLKSPLFDFFAFPFMVVFRQKASDRAESKITAEEHRCGLCTQGKTQEENSYFKQGNDAVVILHKHIISIGISLL